MAMSGITVADEIPTLYSEMKMQSSIRWMTFKIQDKKQIVVDKVCRDEFETDKEAFQNFISTLVPEEPRYALYDFRWGNKQCLTFLFWSDDTKAKITQKMIYSSSKDTIKKQFDGLKLVIEANDMNDLDYDECFGRAKQKGDK